MSEHGDEAQDPTEQQQRDLIARFGEFESFFRGVGRKGFEATVAPAWRRLTDEGEALWPVAIAIGGALTMQIALPNDL